MKFKETKVTGIVLPCRLFRRFSSVDLLLDFEFAIPLTSLHSLPALPHLL
jgi:hypothetical protein